MTTNRAEQPVRPQLSVAIPAYNSEQWLPSTIAALKVAIDAAGWTAQVVVVDDGSTDGSLAVLEEQSRTSGLDMDIVSQSNTGRFMARWAALNMCRADLVLLLDSRVLLAPDSLAHIRTEMAEDPENRCWNAHTSMPRDTPLVGRFWDVPTHIFWSRYLRHPRPYLITPANFDSAPKGTGAFLAPRQLLLDAFTESWPEGDPRFTSDDTKILRNLAEKSAIRLDPGFRAVYRPRTSVRQFLHHSFGRGTLFVDSYFGTSAARSAVLVFLAIAPVALAALIVAAFVTGTTTLGWLLIGLTLVAWLAPAVLAAALNCKARSVLAYAAFFWPFVVPFWSGLIRGLWHRAFQQPIDKQRLEDPAT